MSISTTNSGASITSIFPICEQLLSSVTVTSYIPADKLLAICVVAPVLHAYLNRPSPPNAFAKTLPSEAPKQETCSPLKLEITTGSTVMSVGSVMVKDSITEHPFASSTVIEYVPADRFVTILPVAPLSQDIEIGLTPPSTVTSPIPSAAPKQETSEPLKSETTAVVTFIGDSIDIT